MEDLQLLLCVISLFAGVASITISIFINIAHKKKALFYYIMFDISLFVIQAMITLNLYIVRTQNNGILLSTISKGMDIFGTSFSTFFGLFFINTLFGNRITNIKKVVITMITIFQITAITICYLNTNLFIFKHIGQLSLAAVILYEVLFILVNCYNMPDKGLKHAVRILAIITLAFLPFLCLEYFRSNINIIKNLKILKMFALPAYFFTINIFTLICAYTYFNTPAYSVENKLTDYFIKKFHITNKETEVIELLMSGLTYKQIAEKLFISHKTVDNHVQNIYKKLKITNKIQLLNLIRSKEE